MKTACIRFQDCEGDTVTIEGQYAGISSVSEDRDRSVGADCVLETADWWSCRPGCIVPPVNTGVFFCGSFWFVTRSDNIPGCLLGLGLTRAAVACPDCKLDIHRQSVDRQNCDRSPEPVSVATGVRANLHRLESTTENVNDAEICVNRYRICVDTAVPLEAGYELTGCGNSYRVEEVTQSASPRHLQTVTAVEI